MTPLHFATEVGGQGHLAAAELLLSKGANPNVVGFLQETPLHSATKKSNLDLIKLLVSKGANVNRADYNGRTPMHIAVESGHLPLVALLQSLGATLEFEILANGYTPLHVAAEMGSAEVLEHLLLNASADPSKQSRDGLDAIALRCRQRQCRVPRGPLAKKHEGN
eukprot:GILI01027885.1.p1 GENE.GILI01027885.1~~GILI01027885.1.p1  ORF type:complete len:172 (-),score=20.70 GILI01027885.1:726-1220(-)